MPLLRNNFLTKNLNDQELAKLAAAMKPERYKKGQVIIKYGDVGQHYYILSRGSVKVTVYKPGTPSDDPQLQNKILLTKDLGSGSGFGELALLYNDKRSATIEATEPC